MRKDNPLYMVVEYFADGTSLRRISGSYQLCWYVASGMKKCGFDVRVELYTSS